MPQVNRNDVINRAIGLYDAERNIDVIKLAKGLGISVYPKDDGDFSAQILYLPESDKFEIHVNPSHVSTRQRFSIAHEIAHYILHNDDVRHQRTVGREDSNSSLEPEKEKQADKLAAEILMPDSIVRNYVDKNDLDGDKPISENSVKKIASFFKVSLMTAILRLKELDYHVSYISFA